MQHLAQIKKFSDQPEQRMVYAEVYAPMRPDSDGEFMTAETIRTMAHKFARDGLFKQVDVQHNNQIIKGVEIVESWIAMKGDPVFIEGSWVVGVYVGDDATWTAIKSGDINGFSVEAMVNYVEREVEIDLPEVVTGRTTKAEDHEHSFQVRYDPDTGKMLGGATDFVNGHMHMIAAGTVTEKAAGHSHRFSSVDTVIIS